jgi:hypothetical protein
MIHARTTLFQPMAAEAIQSPTQQGDTQLVFILAVAVIVLFALYRKGDVTASLSLKRLAFSLKAKDRPSRPTQIRRK